MNHLAKNLLFLRKHHQLTQAEMPAHIGISRVTWSNYENGVSEPDIAKLIDIADLFVVNIDDIIRVDLSKNTSLPAKFVNAGEEKKAIRDYPTINTDELAMLNEDEVSYKKTMKKEIDLLILTQLNVIAADVKELKKKLRQ